MSRHSDQPSRINGRKAAICRATLNWTRRLRPFLPIPQTVSKPLATKTKFAGPRSQKRPPPPNRKNKTKTAKHRPITMTGTTSGPKHSRKKGRNRTILSDHCRDCDARCLFPHAVAYRALEVPHKYGQSSLSILAKQHGQTVPPRLLGRLTPEFSPEQRVPIPPSSSSTFVRGCLAARRGPQNLRFPDT